MSDNMENLNALGGTYHMGPPNPEPKPQPKPPSVLSRFVDGIINWRDGETEAAPAPVVEVPAPRWPGITGGIALDAVAFVALADLSAVKRTHVTDAVTRAARLHPHLVSELEQRAGVVDGLGHVVVRLDVLEHVASPQRMTEWPNTIARLFGLDEAVAILSGPLDPRAELSTREAELVQFEKDAAAMRLLREERRAQAEQAQRAINDRQAMWGQLPALSKAALGAAMKLPMGAPARTALELLAVEIVRGQFVEALVPQDGQVDAVLRTSFAIMEEASERRAARERGFGPQFSQSAR